MGQRQSDPLSRSMGSLLPDMLATAGLHAEASIMSSSASVAAAGALTPQPSKQTNALVKAARAHCEHQRLERELQTLRSVARRQRGEVKLLSNKKAELTASANDRELERQHRKEVQRQERQVRRREEEYELERCKVLDNECAIRERELQLEALQNRSREREQLLEQREKEFEDKQRRHREQLLEQREKEFEDRQRRQREPPESPVKPTSHIDRRSLVKLGGHPAPSHYQSRDLGDFDDTGAATPLSAIDAVSTSSARQIHAEPEAEADSDTNGELMENRRLKHELEGLRDVDKRQRQDGALMENRRLKQELEGLREVDKRQRDEMGVAAVTLDSNRRVAVNGHADHRVAAYHRPKPSPTSQGLFNPVRQGPDAWDAVADGVASRAAAKAQASNDYSSTPLQTFALRAGMQEYDRSVQAAMGRVVASAKPAAHGEQRHVFARGAVNANGPSSGSAKHHTGGFGRRDGSGRLVLDGGDHGGDSGFGSRFEVEERNGLSV